MPQLLMPKKLKLTVSMKTSKTSRTNTKTNKQTKKNPVFFTIGDWNAKVGSQEIPRVTSKFGLGVQNEAGKRLTEFCQENILVITNTIFQQHKKQPSHGHHQMVNTKIIDALYSLQLKMEKLYRVSKNKTWN